MVWTNNRSWKLSHSRGVSILLYWLFRTDSTWCHWNSTYLLKYCYQTISNIGVRIFMFHTSEVWCMIHISIIVSDSGNVENEYSFGWNSKFISWCTDGTRVELGCIVIFQAESYEIFSHLANVAAIIERHWWRKYFFINGFLIILQIIHSQVKFILRVIGLASRAKFIGR